MGGCATRQDGNPGETMKMWSLPCFSICLTLRNAGFVLIALLDLCRTAEKTKTPSGKPWCPQGTVTGWLSAHVAKR